jgi:hypothetical protein
MRAPPSAPLDSRKTLLLTSTTPNARRKQPVVCNHGEVTKRDFTAIAKICCETDTPRETSERLAGYFRSQNPRFDRDRFLRATEACKG